MNIRPITELTLYRYRYVIGYALLGVLIIGLLLLNFQILPPGLSAAEQTSAVASSSINFNFHLSTLGQDILTFLRSINTVDLPYHLLQKASLEVFGLSPLGVRLPSIALAAVSAFMLLVMLKRWVLPSAAMVTGVFVASSSWFLAVGRLGTPDIMVIFWTISILLLATLVSQEASGAKAWKVLSLLAIGLSLYTPYTLYLFIATAIAAFAQPHLRYVLRYTGRLGTTVGIILFLIVLTPLGYNIWRDPGIIWQLLAIPVELPGPIAFLQNLIISLSNIANPFLPAFEQVPLPLVSMPILVLALFSVWRLIIDWHSVRSHVLLLWLAILIPLIGLDVTHNLVVLFVPIVLLSAIGVQSLFTYWYRLFPLNPYARVFGLLPIGLLIFSILQFNYQRYFLALPFTPSTARIYNQDSFILHNTLSAKINRDQRIVLVVPASKVALYKIDQATAKNLTVVTLQGFVNLNPTRVIVAESEVTKLNPTQLAILPQGKTELLVNDRKADALRFRVYYAP